MMNFRKIKESLVELLGSKAAGRFKVIGYQKQIKNASETEGNNRAVEIFYSDGDMPKKGSSLTGPIDHDMEFKLEFTVSAQAKADLVVLENPGSTTAEVETALAELQVATKIADDSIDELWELVYQILMDALEVGLGLLDEDGKENVVQNRWVGEFRKDTAQPKGELVILTASAKYTCRTDEEITGDTVTSGEVMDTTLNQDDDKENIAGTREEL